MSESDAPFAHHPYESSPVLPGWIAFVISGGLAMLIRDAGWRLLLAASAFAALAWIISEARWRLLAVTLDSEAVHIPRPFRRTLTVPYAWLAGVIESEKDGRLIIAWTPEGSRRSHVARLENVHDQDALREALQARASGEALAPDKIESLWTRRTIRRAIWIAIALILLPFAVILFMRFLRIYGIL